MAQPEHRSVQEVLRRWKMIGGELLLARPVLFETAYHAQIAEIDFREVETWLPGSELDRLRLIKVAFVRAFAHLLAVGRVKSKSHWKKYIAQFRGTHPRDYRPLLQSLKAELPFGDLPQAPRAWTALRDRAERYLLGRRTGRHRSPKDEKIIRDKAQRDADLYAAMLAHTEHLRNADPGASCLLITSSGRLKRLEGALGEQGDAELVLSVPVVLHLLSLVPGVSLGIKAMRAVLFERTIGAQKNDLERVLLRVVRESGEYSIPWAKRAALEKEVRSRIVAFARSETSNRRERQAREHELVQGIISGRAPEAAATIIGEALQRIGAESQAERELAKAKARIRELEQQLRIGGRG